MIGKYDRVGAVAHLFAHAPMDATIDPSFAYIRPLLLLRSYGVLRECYLQDCDVVFFLISTRSFLFMRVCVGSVEAYKCSHVPFQRSWALRCLMLVSSALA